MHNYICVRPLCSEFCHFRLSRALLAIQYIITVFIHGHYWLQTRLMRDKQLHFLSIGAQLESTNKMEKRVLNKRVNMANLSLAWTGDYNSLKSLVRDELKLDCIWEQPGGYKNVFTSSDFTSIWWSKEKKILTIVGKDSEQLKQKLFSMLIGEKYCLNL